MGLSKACPKDPFPLPRIDEIVDSTLGCETLCFLDVYSGYHQITMRVRPAHDVFYHPLQIVPLHLKAIRSEERQGNLPALYAQLLRGPHRANR